MRLPVLFALLVLFSSSSPAGPPPGIPEAVRGLPLQQIRHWSGDVVDWAYAHYSAGRGIGSATLECPSPVLVGRILDKCVVTVRAGAGGIAPGGSISVLFPLGSTPPQTDDHQSPGFVTATSGLRWLKVKTQMTWFFRQHRKFAGPMHQAMATVELPDGLAEGKTVVFTRYRAHAGNLARRWEGERFTFRVYVDHDADGWEEEIPDSPWVPKQAAETERLVIRAQSTAVVGEPVRLVVTAMDRFDNPATGYRGNVDFAHQGGPDGMPGRYAFTGQDAGAHTFQARFDRPGYYWITVRDQGGGFEAESNPIEVLAEEPRYRLYWGDLHVHTEMSADAWNSSFATSTYGGSYNTGRFRYGLDFMANTDHHSFKEGNYAYEDWQRMIEITNEANRPGEFVTLVATEISHGRGDQNVYFPGDTMPFLRTGPNHPHELWDSLRAFDCFTVPHHFAQNMRPWDWHNYDADLMRVAEIFSTHGRAEYQGNEPHYSSHSQPTLEGRTWQDQLATGRMLGAIAASDDHQGRPGSSGLAGVWAGELSREAIYQSLKSRRTYATTNARAILRYTVNGEEMGQTVESQLPPVLRVTGATPTGILELHVVKNNAVVFEGEPGGRTFDFTWQDPDFAGDAYYYIRIKLAGQPSAEGFLRDQPEFVWSSPVWVSKKRS